jgi:guanine deaminase
MNGFMEQAIDLAAANVRRGGGPFAALVVKDGVLIASGANRVTLTNDPTAHAEVEAIRQACKALGCFQLAGCEVYSSCEPCPMCLGALCWARPARVYFAATARAAAAAGFDDAFIYRQIETPYAERAIPMVHLASALAARPFEEWARNPDRRRY